MIDRIVANCCLQTYIAKQTSEFLKKLKDKSGKKEITEKLVTDLESSLNLSGKKSSI